jgi:chloramphenicol O-acetyltransferase type A
VNRPETIDVGAWARAEHFEHYRDRVPCSYAITVEIDVTELVSALRRSGRKTYPAQIWALATVVNRHREFRMALDEEGRPAAWAVLHPAFTVFNPARETFACVWTPYDEDFSAFHGRVADLLAEHKDATTMFPQGAPPPDSFDVSSLPWTAFTAFDLHIAGGERHLLPIFTLGRHVERSGRTLVPLAVQVHHAAADGFHTARLVSDLRALVAEPDWV